MRWAGHIACMGGVRNAYNVLVENLKGEEYLEDLGVDRKVILESTLGK
jgi:hypothetical protein